MQTKLNWDVVLGVLFAGLGGILAVRAWTFPEGTSGVPGPGFFPLLVGFLLMGLGVLLAVQRAGRGVSYWEKGWSSGPVLRIAAVLAALAVYLTLWGRVSFLVRTPLLLFVIYRVLGESWWRAAVLSLLITGGAYGVFEGFFNVRL